MLCIMCGDGEKPDFLRIVTHFVSFFILFLKIITEPEKNPNIYTFLIRLEYFVLMSLSSFHAGFSFKSDVQLKNTRKRSALILWIWLPKWMKLVCSCAFSHFTSLNFVQLHFNQQHSSSSHLDFMCRFLFIFFFHFKNNDLNEKKERINMEK